MKNHLMITVLLFCFGGPAACTSSQPKEDSPLLIPSTRPVATVAVAQD